MENHKEEFINTRKEEPIENHKEDREDDSISDLAVFYGMFIIGFLFALFCVGGLAKAITGSDESAMIATIVATLGIFLLLLDQT